MKKTLTAIFIFAFAFGLGFGLNNVAFSSMGNLKVATVNVPKLLVASKTLKAAQDARDKQTQEMLKWYSTASADIAKQSTAQGKQALVKKYEAQLDVKKKAIKDSYSKKVAEIDAQLNSAITTRAKAMGYDLVFRKESLLFGGTDITTSILPLVK